MEESHRSIKDWMNIFKDLYSESDAKRTPEQMWIAVMAHTSSIGENIRKLAYESLLNSAAHTFCWLCSFVNKCNELPDDDIFHISESLCEIVSLKYPHVCGYCKESPCSCNPVKMEVISDKSAMYTKLLELREGILKSHEGYSIENYQKMFYEIYSGRGHIQTLENIGFHFLEEIGEAAVYIRKLSQLREITNNSNTEIDKTFLKQLSTVKYIVENYAKYKKRPEDIDYTSTDPSMLRSRLVEAKMGLVAEIGDSFSWFCAVLNKLDSISKSMWDHPEKHEKTKTLEQVLNEEYIDSTGKSICPICKNKSCKCVFYNLGSGS